MTGYYDYIFGFTPLALLGITGTLTIAGLQSTTVVPTVAGVVVLLTGHVLFVNGSSSPPPPRLNEYVGPNAVDASSPPVLNVD